MHIHVVPNRGSPPTVLLRESYREGSKVLKRTLANLSSLSAAQIEAFRSTLRGDALALVAQSFEAIRSPAHGHVQAVALTLQRLGLASVVSSKPCRERDLRAGDGGCAHPAAPHQAGHHTLVAHHDAGRGVRCGRCR
jgi:hypothetical protein